MVQAGIVPWQHSGSAGLQKMRKEGWAKTAILIDADDLLCAITEGRGIKENVIEVHWSEYEDLIGAAQAYESIL